MSDTLPRICFLGCGDMAVRHTETLRKLFSGIQISYASRDAARAKRVSQDLKGAASFGSYEEALGSRSFDIAFLTTPHAFHADLAILAAEQGKDIIIEKPVTRTVGEFEAIQAAVDRAGVRCTVAENYFYKPIIQTIRGFIEDGLIGEVLFLELTKTNREDKTGWRTDEKLMGGGALLEGGVHWLNALTSLSGGIPKEVVAARPDVAYGSNIPVEDSILLVARFSNGVVGQLLHSWRIPNRFFGLGLSKIFGTEGVITLESNGLFCSVYGKKNRKRLMNPFEFLGFRAMHRAFVTDWMEGQGWHPTLGRIGDELRMVHAAYRSLESGRFESI